MPRYLNQCSITLTLCIMEWIQAICQEKPDHGIKIMRHHFILQCKVGMILLGLGLSACAGQQVAIVDSSESLQQAHRILITNDDGIQSEGIRQLAIAVSEFAEVVVVAPEKNESGASQSSRLLSVRAQATPVEISDSVVAYALNGTPSDCTAFGIRAFGREEPFDLVLSGINDGGNYGTAYQVSGTIGAAFQALADDTPAIAVSQDRHRESFVLSVDFTVKVVKALLSNPMPSGVLLSINVPAGQIQGVKAVAGFGDAYFVEVESASDETGTFYKPLFQTNDQPDSGSDLEAYQQGYITVTPLKLDRNDYESLDDLGGRSFIKAWSEG